MRYAARSKFSDRQLVVSASGHVYLGWMRSLRILEALVEDKKICAASPAVFSHFDRFLESFEAELQLQQLHGVARVARVARLVLLVQLARSNRNQDRGVRPGDLDTNMDPRGGFWKGPGM